MKLSIGINTYTSFSELNLRQRACIQSLQISVPVNATLYNIDLNHNNFNNFRHILLKRTSNDIIKNSTRGLAMSKDVFNILSETDCDYFAYLNDDINVSPDAFDVVQKENRDCYIYSRIDTEEITHLESIPKRLSCNLHGFDMFIIKKKWWLENKKYFPNFILGRYYWDTYYYCLCHIFGNTVTLNEYPYIFHPAHESVSNIQDIETKHNFNLLQNNIIDLWFKNININFKNRKSKFDIKDLKPSINEKEIEKNIFKGFYEKNFSNICR